MMCLYVCVQPDREGWSSKGCDLKRVMYLDHNAFRGGGKGLGHVVAADWKWFGRKVKDHVSMRMCVRSRMDR